MLMDGETSPVSLGVSWMRKWWMSDDMKSTRDENAPVGWTHTGQWKMEL